MSLLVACWPQTTTPVEHLDLVNLSRRVGLNVFPGLLRGKPRFFSLRGDRFAWPSNKQHDDATIYYKLAQKLLASSTH